MKTGCISLLLFVALAPLATAEVESEPPSPGEMWALIQRQQEAIAALQTQLTETRRSLQETKSNLSADFTRTETRVQQNRQQVEDTQSRLEATADMVDASLQSAPLSAGHSVGGYGEVHYNNLDRDEIDLHRFVLFAGHQFSNNLQFFSELEVEHDIAGDGKVGEVEVEQAYLQWQFTPASSLNMGVLLVPVGLLNETHEPDTFFGVERNPVEKNIIPATWWEAGAMLSGEIAPGWNYDLAILSGLNLDTDNGSASKRSSIRSARQKVGKADAEDLSYTGRIRYSGLAGVQFGLTLHYQQDMTQNDADGTGVGAIDGFLLETDLSYQRGPVSLKALYARWDLDDQINTLDLGSDRQVGWYIEPAYRFAGNLGLFGRYSYFDTSAGRGADSAKRQFDVGINYWLHPRFVIKLDLQRQDYDSGSEQDGFNLGIGYSF